MFSTKRKQHKGNKKKICFNRLKEIRKAYAENLLQNKFKFYHLKTNLYTEIPLFENNF